MANYDSTSHNPRLDKKPRPLSSQSPHLSVYKHGGRVNYKTGGRVGLKSGSEDWISDAAASIKKRGTKGKCTPITKKGCTGRAKALAKTFKKIAADNKKS